MSSQSYVEGIFTSCVDEIANNVSIRRSSAQKRVRHQVSPLYPNIDAVAPPLFRSRPGLLMAGDDARCFADEKFTKQCRTSFVQHLTTTADRFGLCRPDDSNRHAP
jgi:hypothetical protein